MRIKSEMRCSFGWVLRHRLCFTKHKGLLFILALSSIVIPFPLWRLCNIHETWDMMKRSHGIACLLRLSSTSNLIRRNLTAPILHLCNSPRVRSPMLHIRTANGPRRFMYSKFLICSLLAMGKSVRVPISPSCSYRHLFFSTVIF